MKKTCQIVISALLIVCFSLNAALALDAIAFTHPEIGEIITLYYRNGMPSFQIYGYTYYEIFDPATPHRGMLANQPDLINGPAPLIDESLQKLFLSVEGKSGEPAPAKFEYKGPTEPFTDQLNALPLPERIKAIKRINGFDGADGYAQLAKMPGFEKVDAKALAAAHLDYYVRIGGQTYPYRILMYRFEGKDAEDYSIERHNYIQVNGAWKLARITKEYTDSYEQRTQYIHGLSGSDPAVIAPVHEELTRGATWDMTAQDVSALDETSVIQENTVRVNDTALFEIPIKLAYQFKDNKLAEIVYTADGREAFYSIFISLYMRYSDPIVIKENGDVSWSFNDLQIGLSKGDNACTLSLTPAAQ